MARRLHRLVPVRYGTRFAAFGIRSGWHADCLRSVSVRTLVLRYDRSVNRSVGYSVCQNRLRFDMARPIRHGTTDRPNARNPAPSIQVFSSGIGTVEKKS